ncbi:MAG: KTSC domain-containing protein [Planctomycetota bacterium]|nr:MAG: KTSC domain-containing protein [Planctomycetota bacterium]REK31626.1 MAG: KTSC domain-containing protein [Planctomycetota bacterium]REK42372.1 MAG: KTSC domain-containing protein [Planctomycetota bacterium]
MHRTAVSSSNVASIGYDRDAVTLEVEFVNGSVYQYFDVPEHVYDQLMQASSKGAYLNEHVKDSYRYAKI